jgi:hypothetical protein
MPLRFHSLRAAFPVARKRLEIISAAALMNRGPR